MTPLRTLVVHTGGIGDFLLACPSIMALGREGSVELLGRKDRLELAVAGGIAESAHGLERAGFDSVFDTPSQRLRDFLAPFHRVVVWMEDAQGDIRRGLEACGVAKIQIHPGLPPADWTRHASAYYLDCLGRREDPNFKLSIAPADAQHDVVIHPGSGSQTKNWPLEKYADLARSLESSGREVTWCLGPAEIEQDAEAFSRLPNSARRIVTDSLVDLAAHLAAARSYIGNDSGITHLAEAVGCPAIALFGPTNPEVWAPRGCRVLRFEEASVDAIRKAMGAQRNRVSSR